MVHINFWLLQKPERELKSITQTNFFPNENLYTLH